MNSPDCDPFKLGDVEVTVGPCSPLNYFLIGRFGENIGLGYELQEGTAVRLNGVTSDNALEYLDKALFKIGISQDMGMVWPTAGVESSPDYFSEYLNNFSDEIGDRDFKHASPINSFNGAMRSGSKHEKFLYLYKILEFFWRSAFLEKVVTLRTGKLDDLAYGNAIFELNNYRELERLKSLLEILVDEDVEEVLKNDLLLDMENVGKLAADIYDFRNSIVHAKEEQIDKAEPAERYSGEFSNETLLEGTEYLALKAIERWSVV